MIWLIKQVFIALFSFSEPLAAKCLFLDNEPCIFKPTFIDLSPIELNYFLFVIILDKYNGSCNAVHDLSYLRICLPSKTKDKCLL